MRTHQAKVGIALLVVAGLVVFAVVRVLPYTQSRPVPAQTGERRELARTITDAVTPAYEEELLSVGVDELRSRLLRKAQAALLNITPSDRPRDPDARVIAAAFADFVVLNRTGTPDDAVDSYRRRGLPLHDFLQHDDPEILRKRWSYSTAWARHAPIDPETIRAGPYFVAGERRRFGFAGAPISARPLRSGASLALADHRHTAYDIVMKVTVPNLDGKSEHPVDIYITIANDGLNGGWDVIQTTWNGLPPGKAFVLPPP